MRLTPDVAVVKALPPITGPGECAADDVVRLDAVLLKDKRRVMLSPPATVSCHMAESVVGWVRDEVAVAASDLGVNLQALINGDSFNCRPRNNVPGALISEHGRANALDVMGFRLSNRKVITLADRSTSKVFRERMRQSACSRFTTVLGPGSDSHHENHVHLDLAERRHGYRMCQWQVDTPETVANVPMPPERPKTIGKL